MRFTKGCSSQTISLNNSVKKVQLMVIFKDNSRNVYHIRKMQKKKKKDNRQSAAELDRLTDGLLCFSREAFSQRERARTLKKQPPVNFSQQQQQKQSKTVHKVSQGRAAIPTENKRPAKQASSQRQGNWKCFYLYSVWRLFSLLLLNIKTKWAQNIEKNVALERRGSRYSVEIGTTLVLIMVHLKNDRYCQRECKHILGDFKI